MPPSFLVTGATGYQGGSLARVLLAQNQVVHALVRDPTSEKARTLESLGAVIFKGSYDDVDVIKKAISGVSGVFLNPFPTPMNPELQIQHAKNIIDAAANENCHIVLSTAFKTAQKESWQGSGPQDFLYLYYSKKFAIEAEVRAAKLKSYTILRPAYLMHNYLLPFSYFHYPDLPKQGVMKHMSNDGRKMAHLDSADVGKIAAVVLLDPERYDKLEIDLAAQNLHPDEAMEIIRKASGRSDLRTERLVIENFDTVTKTGLTWHHFMNTQDTTLSNQENIEKKFGIKLTTFSDYLERENELFTRSLPALAN